jgi:hypothetical protein
MDNNVFLSPPFGAAMTQAILDVSEESASIAVFICRSTVFP